MKSLPDDELFNAFENRLRNYNELPDDDTWDKIAGAVAPIEPTWIGWANGTGSFTSALAFLLLVYGFFTNTNQSNTVTTKSGDKAIPSERRTRATMQVDPQHMQSTVQPAKIGIGHTPMSGNPSAQSISNHRSPFFHVDTSDRMIEHAPGDNASSEPLGHSETLARHPVSEIQNDSITAAIVSAPLDSAMESTFPPAEKSPKRKKSGISIYGTLTPSLSFQQVEPLSDDEVVIQKFNSPGILSVSRLGVSLEVGVQGNITKRFHYLAGLSLYHQSTEISYEQQTTDHAIVESGDDNDYMIKPGVNKQSFDYRMTNLGVQAGILYVLHEHKLIHKAGIVLQYQQGFQQAADDGIYDNSASRYVNYQLLYRVEYALKPNVAIFLQPVYTHSLWVDEALRAPFHLKQSRAGIGVGIRYRF